jgi:hypothetical protein
LEFGIKTPPYFEKHRPKIRLDLNSALIRVVMSSSVWVLARFPPFHVDGVENTPESRLVKGDETVLIFKHRRTVIFDELVYGTYD